MSATRRKPHEEAPLIWSNALMFALTLAAAVILVPWYGLKHGFSAADWGVFAFFLIANGMAILYRKDLSLAGLGLGWCAFRLAASG